MFKINDQWINDFYQRYSKELTIDKMYQNLADCAGDTSFKYKALCCIDICEEHYNLGALTQDELTEYLLAIRQLIADKNK